MTFSSDINVIILAGGLGTRLRPVLNDRPKVMALINGRPFLTYLLDQINDVGLKDVILCVGHMGKYIETAIGPVYKNLSLSYSYEFEPLGTGGALRNAYDFIDTETVLVVNGDSYCQYDLSKFSSFHKQNNAFISILLTSVSDTARYGRISTDSINHQLLAFEEKKAFSGSGWINAGVYLINRGIISEIPDKRLVSLEKEVFPSLLGKKLYGFMNEGKFLDIGTPEDFADAGVFLKNL